MQQTQPMSVPVPLVQQPMIQVPVSNNNARSEDIEVLSLSETTTKPFVESKLGMMEFVRETEPNKKKVLIETIKEENNAKMPPDVISENLEVSKFAETTNKPMKFEEMDLVQTTEPNSAEVFTEAHKEDHTEISVSSTGSESKSDDTAELPETTIESYVESMDDHIKLIKQDVDRVHNEFQKILPEVEKISLMDPDVTLVPVVTEATKFDKSKYIMSVSPKRLK